MVVGADGVIQESSVASALVQNHAKLAYRSVAAWLDGVGPMPPRIGEVNGLVANLRLQLDVARKLKERRHAQGALDFKTVKIRPKFDGEAIKDVEAR